MNPIDQMNLTNQINANMAADRNALNVAQQNAFNAMNATFPQGTDAAQGMGAPWPPQQAAYQPYPAYPPQAQPAAQAQPAPAPPAQPVYPTYPQPPQYQMYPQYMQPAYFGYAAPGFSVRMKDPRKTGGRRMFSLMALLLVAQVALSFVVQLVVILGCAAAGYNIYDDQLALVFVVAGLSPICTGAPFLIYMMVGKKDWNSHLRFEKAGFFTGLLCVLAGLGLCLVGNYPAFFIQDLLKQMGATPAQSVLGNGGGWVNFIVEFLGVAVLVPMIEEFAFRGVLLSALRRFGTGFAIVGSAIIFGIAHMELSSVVFATIAGLAMGWVYARTNNLWLTIAIHALNNGLSVIGSYASLFTASELAANDLQEWLTIIPLGLGLLAGLLLLIFHRRLLKKPVPAGQVPAQEGQAPQVVAVQAAAMRPLSAGESIGCILKSPVFWAVLAMVLVETGTQFL